jgi:4-amino-4-deoxy-L-arabinose transferase-like glycosyltransferase
LNAASKHSSSSFSSLATHTFLNLLPRQNNSSRKTGVIACILVFHLLAWLFLKPVWAFGDDYYYAKSAHLLLQGDQHFLFEHFRNRIGLYFPTCLLFGVFGVNPYTISFGPLLFSLLTIACVFFFTNRYAGLLAASLASTLIAFNTLQLSYSIVLFPDIVVAFYTTTMVLVLFRARASGNKPALFALCIAALFMAGLYTKESVLLVLPFLGLLCLVDLRKGQNKLFWLLLPLFSFAFTSGSAYLLFGDAFHPLHVFLNFSSHDLVSYNLEVSRPGGIGLEPHFIFSWLNGQLGILFLLVFSMPTFFKLLHQLYFFSTSREKSQEGEGQKTLFSDFSTYISIYTLLLLAAYLAFFHSSLYGIAFSCDRYWLPLLAPMAICSALALPAMNTYRGWGYIAVFILLAVCNYYLHGFSRSFLSLVFATASGLVLVFNSRPRLRALGFLAPFVILCGYFLIKNSNLLHPEVRTGNALREQLVRMNTGCRKTVLCTEKFTDNCDIYSQFIPFRYLHLAPYAAFDSLQKSAELYVLVDTEENALPIFVTARLNDWKPYYLSKGLLIFKFQGLDSTKWKPTP